jgi:hypothetical protein
MGGAYITHEKHGKGLHYLIAKPDRKNERSVHGCEDNAKMNLKEEEC